MCHPGLPADVRAAATVAPRLVPAELPAADAEPPPDPVLDAQAEQART
jgi:hypothetical protein